MSDIASSLAKDFTTAKLFAYIIFGAIGFGVFMYGKKNKFMRPTMIGLALMIYPYFISNTFALYGIGLALTAAIYFWRE